MQTGFSVAPPDPPDASDHEGDADDPGDDLVEDGEVIDGDAVDDPPAAARRLIGATHFSGPLPSPDTLAEYDVVVPGLGREIVDQWKAETGHRHATIDGLREADLEAMRLFHEGEKRGQRYALAAVVLLLLVSALAVILDRPVIGVAGFAAAAIAWALRRRSDVPDSPPTVAVDLGDGDKLELPTDAPRPEASE